MELWIIFSVPVYLILFIVIGVVGAIAISIKQIMMFIAILAVMLAMVAFLMYKFGLAKGLIYSILSLVFVLLGAFGYYYYYQDSFSVEKKKSDRIEVDLYQVNNNFELKGRNLEIGQYIATYTDDDVVSYYIINGEGYNTSSLKDTQVLESNTSKVATTNYTALDSYFKHKQSTSPDEILDFIVANESEMNEDPFELCKKKAIGSTIYYNTEVQAGGHYTLYTFHFLNENELEISSQKMIQPNGESSRSESDPTEPVKYNYELKEVFLGNIKISIDGKTYKVEMNPDCTMQKIVYENE